MATLKVLPAPGTGAVTGSFQGQYSGVVTAASDGSLSIDSRDLAAAFTQGYLPAATDVRSAAFSAPLAANATVLVGNVTTANGNLTVAAQPDVDRPAQVVSAPGSPGITAGSLAVPYTANDGSAMIDTFSLIGAATATFVTTKGVLKLGTPVISGLVGGTSPTIEIGTNATLAANLPPGAVDMAILKETLDGADVGANVGTLAANGLYTPHTAPNATHTFSLTYTVLSVPA